MDEALVYGEGVSEGIPLLDRARVLLDAGLARDADNALARAGAIFAKSGWPRTLPRPNWPEPSARCWPATSRPLAGSPAGPAIDSGGAATIAGARRRAGPAPRRSVDRSSARAARAGGAAAAAELRTQGLSGRARTAALVAAECLLAVGQLDAAAELVADPPAAGDPISVRLHDRYVRARLDETAGRRDSARRHVRAGLDELATYQASFGGMDLRTASAAHGSRLAELDVSMAVDGGSPTAVLAAIERGRAVSSRLSAIRPPADPQTADLLAELRQLVETVRADASQAPTLQPRRAELERQIKGRSWTLPGGGHVQQPASSAAIRAAVADADAVLVAYVRVGGRLHGLRLDARRVTLHELGDADDVDALVRRARADLDVLAYERLPAAIRGAASASLSRSLVRLDELLVRPLRAGGHRLVVVPTGLLAALPWTSIPSRRGEPVVVTPSATAWVTARAAGSAGGELIALAGPDLRRADHEVAEIGRIRLGATVSAGATRAELAAAMATAATVHVAAHGQHQTENPLFSSIRMADGPMFAHELDHAAPHVVLSACELGMATIRPGDEALGLTSVLLHLGSRTVVSGVARVGDDAASEAMLGYHRRLAVGRDSAEALAEAVSSVDEPTPFVTFGV